MANYDFWKKRFVVVVEDTFSCIEKFRLKNASIKNWLTDLRSKS